jgi:hypothetical protein
VRFAAVILDDADSRDHRQLREHHGRDFANDLFVA